MGAHSERNMLELVTDDSSQSETITYRQGLEYCNQLLLFFRKHGVQQGDRVFIMCGLNKGLWISYLAAIKGGLVLIPAASILSADDIVYRFQKALPKVIITDQENAGKMEQALSQYHHPVKVKLVLDGERNGWSPLKAIDTEEGQAISKKKKKDDDLFGFYLGTTGMPKVVVHTQAKLSLGPSNATGMDWIETWRQTLQHFTQPGWAKFAWSCVFAPLNLGATVFVFIERTVYCEQTTENYRGSSNHYALCTANCASVNDTGEFKKSSFFPCANV